MSFSTCVVRCEKCGECGDVSLSSYLCTKCRVEKRREEDAIYDFAPPKSSVYHIPNQTPTPTPKEKKDKSITDIFNSIFRRK